MALIGIVGAFAGSLLFVGVFWWARWINRPRSQPRVLSGQILPVAANVEIHKGQLLVMRPQELTVRPLALSLGQCGCGRPANDTCDCPYCAEVSRVCDRCAPALGTSIAICHRHILRKHPRELSPFTDYRRI